MFDFLFPASMAAGGVLISSPIIIHLINRMRFKRVRWAAMEFLLKSQKRNRRRLIIEQLLLLLMRIILVLLAALIVARFIGGIFGGVQAQTTQHLILLDDTPSMMDQWLDAGERKNSFKEAKRVIVDEIARNAAKAGKAQHLKLITATQSEQVRDFKRLGDDSIRELNAALATIEPSALHVDLIEGVKKARKLFEDTPQDQRVLYIVSDFRFSDWSGRGGEALFTELSEMRRANVNIKFVDMADPPRKEGEKDARYHDNIAVVNVRPEARITARNRLTEFTATVVNHSLIERKLLQVKVKANGQERAESDVLIPVLRPNERTEVKFHVFLDQLGINQVTASIDAEEAGLAIDNTRYAVVDVRERVPILLIDGDPINSRKEGGDAYYLQLMFNANRGVAAGYDLIIGTPTELERPNLEQYPSIYLINVRELNDKPLHALENYVREGGNVAFVMGERVNPEFYNRKLYNNGNGVFPVLLADRPTNPLTPEEKEARIQADIPQLFFQTKSQSGKIEHPIFSELSDSEAFFKYITIDRYWPAPRARWKRKDGKTEELVTLPNHQSVDDYKDAVQDVLAKLPLDNPKYEKYKARLTAYRDVIRDLLGGQPLPRLAQTIKSMLEDRGERDNPGLPNLQEFWGSDDPDITTLRTRFQELQETTQFGDPLVVAGTYGKGRTIVWLTSLGLKWNDWARRFPVGMTFPMVMFELQKWLTAGTAQTDLLVGTPLTISMDATRFEDKMSRLYRPETRDPKAAPPRPDAEKLPAGAQAGDEVMGEQAAVANVNGKLQFRFTDARKPGVYVLEFTPKTEEGGRREVRGFAFNIDTDAESNLLRADRSLLLDKVKDSKFYGLGSTDFSELEQKQRDLSEGPWLFVLFLLILVLEQALAVHLSYHVSQGEAPTPAPKQQPA